MSIFWLKKLALKFEVIFSITVKVGNSERFIFYFQYKFYNILERNIRPQLLVIYTRTFKKCSRPNYNKINKFKNYI